MRLFCVQLWFSDIQLYGAKPCTSDLLLLIKPGLYFQTYVKTLCNPEETLQMPYPPELHPLLTNSTVKARLENTTQAVLRFPSHGQVDIHGLDSLAVTLAMSALEDVINKHMDIAVYDPEDALGTAANKSHSSDRLDNELRRLSSQEGKGGLENDYSGVNDAVKRTILSWMMEDSEGGGDWEAKEMTAGNKDVKFKSLGIPVQQLEKIQLGATQPGQQQRSESPMEMEIDGATEEDEVDGINLHPEVTPLAVSAGSVTKPTATSAQDPHSFHVTPEEPDDSLKEIALDKGYTEKEIQEVFDEYGKSIRASDFMRALVTNRRLKDSGARPKSNVAVSMIEGLPRPPTSDQLASSPHLRPAMLETEKQAKALKVSVHLNDYLEQRCKDHKEEENCDGREDLIRKNKEQQELLREAYKKREEEKLAREQRCQPNAQQQEKPEDFAVVDLTEEDSAPEESKLDMASGGAKLDQLDDFSLPSQVKSKTGMGGASVSGQKRIHQSDSPQNRDAKKKPQGGKPKTRSRSPNKGMEQQRPQ